MTARTVPVNMSWSRCDAIPALVAATPITTRTGATPRRHQGSEDSSTAASRSAAAGGTREPATAARNALNGAPIGGIKVVAKSGWYAARPSGTEEIYKIYAESFQGKAHLQRILQQAQATVDAALAERVGLFRQQH